MASHRLKKSFQFTRNTTMVMVLMAVAALLMIGWATPISDFKTTAQTNSEEELVEETTDTESLQEPERSSFRYRALNAEAGPRTAGSGESVNENKKDKKEDKKIKRDNKKGKRKYKKKTIETESYITYNADTPHEFKVSKEKKEKRGEKTPNLSESKLEGELIENDQGVFIRYTITLKNIGNTRATDVDVINILDSGLEPPTDLEFKNCGKQVRHSFEENILELSNVTSKKKGEERCRITYKTHVIGDGDITNMLYISPASEGGEEIGPIEAYPVSVSSGRGESASATPESTLEANGEEVKDSEPLQEPEGSSEPRTASSNADSEPSSEESPEEPAEGPTEEPADTPSVADGDQTDEAASEENPQTELPSS